MLKITIISEQVNKLTWVHVHVGDGNVTDLKKNYEKLFQKVSTGVSACTRCILICK